MSSSRAHRRAAVVAQPQHDRLRRHDRAACARRQLGRQVPDFLLQRRRRHDHAWQDRPAMRLLRIDHPPRQQHVARESRTDEVDESRRVADRQAVAESPRHRHAELCPIRTDSQVAGHRNRASAADCGTIDLRNRGHRQLLEPVDQLFEAVLVDDAGIGIDEVPEVGNIGARREGAARTAYDEDAHVLVRADGIEDVGQREIHVPGEGVSRFGTIHCHNRDGFVDHEVDVARWHSCSRCDPGHGRAVLRDVTG